MRLLTTLSLLLLVASFSHAQINSFTLNQKIKAAGASWEAGPSSVSGLSLQEMKSMMDSSLDPHPEVQFEVPESELRSFATPSTWDWRSKDGKNWMSPIRDQAFACARSCSFDHRRGAAAVRGIFRARSEVERCRLRKSGEASGATHGRVFTGAARGNQIRGRERRVGGRDLPRRPASDDA